VVALSIHIACVGFSGIAWEDLETGTGSEQVPVDAVAGVSVRTRVAAGSCGFRSTRCVCTVINVRAADTVAAVPRWASITSKPYSWWRLVVAGDASEARGVDTTNAIAFLAIAFAIAFLAKHSKCEQEVGYIHLSIWYFVIRASHISTATVLIGDCHPGCHPGDCHFASEII
jgi:hypothetical protein